jgi:ATP-dependent DNA helicase RecQ
MRGDLPVRVKLPAPRPAKRLKKRGGLKGPPGLAGAPPAGAAARSDAPIVLGKRDSILFEALRTHRAALAREKSVPPYVIAPDRTLTEIAALRPRSPEELRMAHGMGPARVASYGDAILRIVRDHASPEEPWDG